MRWPALALLLVSCAVAHVPVDAAAGDAERCLFDVPCWCVVHRRPGARFPTADCRHTREECQALEDAESTPCTLDEPGSSIEP